MAVTEFNHFPQIAAALPLILADIVSEVADEGRQNIQGFIVSNGQVRTGYMHDSTHVEPGSDAQSKWIICGAFYGIFQNYGTRYMPGRPFWEPGLEQTRPGFEARLEGLESRLPH